MRKVTFKTERRPTKDEAGKQIVSLDFYGEDGSTVDRTIELGYILRELGSEDYPAYDTKDKLVGVFETRQQAGEALRKQWDLENQYDGRRRGTRAPAAPAQPRRGRGRPRKSEAGAMATAAHKDKGFLLVPQNQAHKRLGMTAAALRKAITAGEVQTRESGGKTMVLVPADKAA